MTIIIAESVRLFGPKYQYLDFDGSMIEPIERFFRGFGAFPVRYGNFNPATSAVLGKVGIFGEIYVG